MNTAEWDYIVVGAGSSGCALTQELVNSGKRVLLVEAGGKDRSPFIKIPAGQLRAIAKHDWGYRSEPDPSREGAAENWSRGRVVGGSSSINGTLYTRGAPADYDRWNVPGWSWNEVLPVFLDFENSDQTGSLRGHEGSLHIRTVKHPHIITTAFVKSAMEHQLTFRADYNAECQEGVGYAQLSQRRGFRCSASDAFLKPLLHRDNLKLELNALVQKIEVREGRATSISFEREGRVCRENASNVVLCAGAVNSPQLLMLSGIGDGRELRQHEIPVVADLPGVGQNLKDQPLFTLMYRTKVPTYNPTKGVVQMLTFAANFLLKGEGPISNIFEGAAFLRSSDIEPAPDLQVIFIPCGWDKRSDGEYELSPHPSVMLHVLYSYPSSSGRIRLASSDPKQPPRIDCRLLEDPSDLRKLALGVAETREIMRTKPISDLITEEVIPGDKYRSEAELAEYIRPRAGISYHPLGTCRMGLSSDSVVGPDLRVRGTENLWVADASVIPEHLSANTNAVCIMIGKKLGKQLVVRG